MDALISHRLAKVTRLAWDQPGDPSDFNAGPVHLVFDDGRGLLLDGRSDWTLEFIQTEPGDEKWLSVYDYDYLGGRWIARDASTEPPFASVIALPLVDWAPTFNAVGEVVGLRLDFHGQQLTLRTWEGEVTT
ncbi:hypothetical protein [Melissospora conviva]|uniref:hypothetical protein n=1 Tax=Melissospora conviva TaxID=3388432 RepID=UPI003C1BFEAB